MQALMSHFDDSPRRYRFFILGVWSQPASQPGNPRAWRISLEDARTAERIAFTAPAELEAYLHRLLEDRADGQSD
ncbi:MAG: hypothetical protein R2844_03100 [Caldilineales bacterium]